MTSVSFSLVLALLGAGFLYFLSALSLVLELSL